MAFMASAVKKIKIKNLPKIGSDIYSMVALNNLVVYAVHYLQEHEVTATVEEIVSICFRLFPQSFALKNYPRWPDSALVIRRLNDAREKEHLKGNSMDGFSVKYKGKLLAQKVTKVLGLAQPAKITKKTASVKRKIVPAQPVNIKAKRIKIKQAQGAVFVKGTKVASQKKKVVVPVKKTPERQISRPASQRIKVKQETLPLMKVKEKPRKKSVKLIVPVLVKKAPIKKKTQKQVKAHLAQMTMAFVPSQKKEVKPVVQISKKKDIAPASASLISKEEKAKAGKFVHLMERSDAYIHYKKNGKNSKIGEFDFRSLLLCTMESSRETLLKNLGLFKGYAGIHNRQDLLIFLEHCEDRFSYLLVMPQNKSMRKVKK